MTQDRRSARSVSAELDLPADLAGLHALGPWLAEFLEASGAGGVHGSFELALHEVCVNVVTHAYGETPGRLRLQARSTPTSIAVEVHDTAPNAYDEADAPEPVPGEPQVHGYGLMIARRLVDELRYTRHDGVNTWLLRSAR